MTDRPEDEPATAAAQPVEAASEAPPPTAEARDDDVPKLPRKLGVKLTGPEMFRIAFTVAMLVAVVMLAKPCGNAVSNFVMGFDGSAGSGSAHGSGGSAMKPPEPYEHLRPGMSDDEVKQAIERAKARSRELNGSGAGSATGAAGGPIVNAVANGSGSAAMRTPANGSAATGSAVAPIRRDMPFHGSNGSAARIDPTQLHVGGGSGIAQPTGSP